MECHLKKDALFLFTLYFLIMKIQSILLSVLVALSSAAATQANVASSVTPADEAVSCVGKK